MKFREIKTEKEYLNYQKLTEQYIGVNFPIPYLKQGKVIGCYDNKEKLCGGFAIILNAPFRVIDSIPIRTPMLDSFNMKDTAEITGLWLSSRMSKNQSLKLWLKLFFTLIFSGKKSYVYAYSLKYPKLGAIYKNGRPIVLFRGETKILPGMKSADKESVEVIHRNNFLLTPFRHPEFLFRRLKGMRKKSVLKFKRIPGIAVE